LQVCETEDSLIDASGRELEAWALRIKSVLGVDGMGEVYRARDCRLNRDVAIKVLREDGVSADLRGRFEREARATLSGCEKHCRTASVLTSVISVHGLSDGRCNGRKHQHRVNSHREWS
jgi:serine/threonine protein kinase